MVIELSLFGADFDNRDRMDVYSMNRDFGGKMYSRSVIFESALGGVWWRLVVFLDPVVLLLQP